jgi:DNA polymerase I-like protein with 3'-5' exonuclease and polymerase domains
MEYNGLLFNEDLSITLGDSFEEQIKTLDEELYKLHQLREFNPNSNDHISALLYGGDISLRRRVSCGTFKTGTRMGEQKEKWEEYKITFNRLVVPIKGSELIKEGFYSTDEKTLKSLRSSNKAKSIIELLLKRTTLEKRLSTYYRGVVNLINELNWKKGVIHGQLNQCVTRTGRLSSSKPNLQNFDGEIKSLFTSRFS